MIDFIKDADCTKETPVRLGVPDAPIYGKGIKLKPRVDGRTDSEHFKKIYLPELLPLEEYDLIIWMIFVFLQEPKKNCISYLQKSMNTSYRI